VRAGYRLGLPLAGRWREVINTDLAIYGGSGVSAGEVDTEAVACDGHAQSALLTLPPLATVMWVCEAPDMDGLALAVDAEQAFEAVEEQVNDEQTPFA
jgi:hypothetical protein